jgi:hypothetical protein
VDSRDGRPAVDHTGVDVPAGSTEDDADASIRGLQGCVNALLMHVGAIDWRSGQKFNDIVFFDEAVDIHHVFPKKWREEHGKKLAEYDSIVNKTPLS